jgi:hypothetical protein
MAGLRCFSNHFTTGAEVYMINERALFERMDRIIVLLESAARRPSLGMRIMNGLATGIGILGIFSIVDIIKTWLGG